MNCKRNLEVKVLMSATGYYVGTLDEGAPNCRLTIYFDNRREAEEFLLETEQEELDSQCNLEFACGHLFEAEEVGNDGWNI